MPHPVLPPAFDQNAVSHFQQDMAEGIIPDDFADVSRNIAGGSPYLRQLMLRDQVFAGRAFAEAPDTLLDEVVQQLQAGATVLEQADVMRLLRQTKARAALLIAVADILQRWSVMQAIEELAVRAQAFGHFDLQHEQGDRDRKDPVGEGEDP